MKVICDTNIWYELASGEIAFDPEGLSFAATYVNLEEIATSQKMLANIEKTKEAIRSMMRARYKLFIPPFNHVALNNNQSLKYNYQEEIHELLALTEKIANNHSVLPEHKDEIAKLLESYRKPFQDFANITMVEVEKIRSQIIDKKAHRKNVSIEGYRDLLCLWLKTSTDNEFNQNEIDWSELELFEKTWMTFFLELEVSQMKFKPNDFFDIFNLVYVSKRDLYFTKDKKIIDIIERAGLSHYLFGKK